MIAFDNNTLILTKNDKSYDTWTHIKLDITSIDPIYGRFIQIEPNRSDSMGQWVINDSKFLFKVDDKNHDWTSWTGIYTQKVIEAIIDYSIEQIILSEKT